jgi:hypothetical protein
VSSRFFEQSQFEQMIMSRFESKKQKAGKSESLFGKQSCAS